MGALGTVARAFSVMAGLATLIVGLTHLFKDFSKWCRPSPAVTCIGDYLLWAELGDELSSGLNGINAWRSVFTFRPNEFVDLWTPTVMGLITIFFHLQSLKWEALCRNWPRMCLWHLVLALWANFGYAGNMGVIVGFITVFASFLCLVAAFVDGGETTTYSYKPMN